MGVANLDREDRVAERKLGVLNVREIAKLACATWQPAGGEDLLHARAVERARVRRADLMHVDATCEVDQGVGHRLGRRERWRVESRDAAATTTDRPIVADGRAAVADRAVGKHLQIGPGWLTGNRRNRDRLADRDAVSARLRLDYEKKRSTADRKDPTAT